MSESPILRVSTTTSISSSWSDDLDVARVLAEAAIRQTGVVVRSAQFVDKQAAGFTPAELRACALRTALAPNVPGSCLSIHEPGVSDVLSGVWTGICVFEYPEYLNYIVVRTMMEWDDDEAHNPDGHAGFRLLRVMVNRTFFVPDQNKERRVDAEVTIDAESLNEAVEALIQGTAFPPALLVELRKLWSE